MNKAVSAPKQSIWNRTHYLDRMTLRDLWIAYFQYPAIIVYLTLSMAAMVVFAYNPTTLVQAIACVAIAILIYPFVWYLLHRYVLHSQWMWKIKWLAPTWKRIHYDHHQDPNHLEVLFGSLVNTLPTIAIATLPIGYAIGGIGGAAIALATGLLTTCTYEFIHCIQHLAYKPKNKWIASMKKRHMAHHFHDENGNFGITNYFWDRVFGTLYERSERPEKSPSVFNLGYTDKVAETYPWVKELSGGIVATGHPRKRKD